MIYQLILISTLFTDLKFNFKYKVGDCVYLVDPENDYKGDKRNVMRIEAIGNKGYVYRWMTFQGQWAIDTDTLPVKDPIKVYETITKLTECPNETTK